MDTFLHQNFGQRKANATRITSKLILFKAILTAFMFASLQTFAQFNFSDNASNYSGVWVDTNNGGTGYNAWAITTGGANAGTFIGNPSGNGIGTAGIGTTAFGLFGHSGQFVNAVRYFGANANNVAMQIGDVFSFHWGMNWDCGSSGAKGFDLRAGTTTIFNVNNSNSSTITTSNGNANTNYGTDAMLVTLTRTSWTQYSFTMTSRSGGATFSTTINSTANIDNINIYCGAQQDNNGNRNIYFNNFNFTKAHNPYEIITDITEPRALIGTTLVKEGTGRLTMTGANSYSGITTVNQGVIRMTADVSLGQQVTGTIVNTGAAVEFSGAFLTAEPFTISGTGISNGGALRNVTNNTRTLSGAVTLNADARINSDQATLIIASTNLNSHTLYAGGNGTVQLNAALTNGGKTTGDGAIFKDGSGELRLMANFTSLSGTVNLTQGTIRINNNNGLGDSGLLVMSNGTTLRPDNTTTRNTPKNVSVLGDITLGYVNQGLTISGNVDLNAGTRQITSIFGNTISGVISNGALTKTGAGPLTLSGNNTYTGNTLISQGVLNANAVGSLGVGSDVFIANGTTLNVNANVEVGSAREAGAGNSGVIAISAGNTLTTIGANQGSYFQNSISGAGGLTMAGSGTTNMNLFGTQSYTGATTVSGGQLTSPVAMATSSLSVSGGVFSAGGANILGNTIPVTVNGGTYQLGGAQTIGSLAGTGGTVSLGASTLTTGNANTNTTYSGVISGTGGLTKIGTGTFTLNGTVNTYTGNTTVNNGTLTVGATNVINAASNLVLTNGTFSLSSGSNLTLNAANMTGGSIARAGDNTFTLNNPSSFTGGTVTYSSTGSIVTSGTTTLGNVTFNSTSTSGTAHNTIRLGGDIVVNNNTTANFTNTGGGAGVRFNLGDAVRTFDVGNNAVLNIDWRINSSTPASGGIVKTGTGRLTITHDATVYTGPTTITAGELRLNPINTAATWTSPTTLNGGALSTVGIAAGTNITNATAGVTLNLNANSSINLGNVNHSITFANSSAVAWNGIELTIFGWTGAAGSSGTNGRIFFGNNSGGLTSDQLGKIFFDGYTGAAILLNSGELVPSDPNLYFRSVASGDWNTLTSWQAADNPSFTGAFTPLYPPNNSNSLLIQIRNAHTITVTSNTVADDLVIDAGGVLTVSSGTFTVANGAAATDFLINGTFNANAPLTINAGTGVSNNNLWQTSTSTLTSAGSSITQAGTAVYNHAANGGTIPISTWNAGSLLRITGTTNSSTIGGMGQTFHHIEYDCPSQTSTSVQLQGEIIGINGNFTMVSTGGTGREFRFFTNTTNTNTSLTVQGDFIMTGGKIAVTNSSSSGTANPTLNINGNLSISGAAIFDLTGNSANTAAGSTVNLLGDLSITGSGTIVRTQNTPSTFRFNRASGIQNFNSHATGISAGQINWQAGNGTTQPVLVLASDFIMQAAATLTVNNAATIEFGTFIARGTTAGINGSFTINSGATLRTGNVNGIVAALNATTGSVQTGTAKTFNAGANYTYNGAANQVTGTGLPLTHTGVLTINNPGNTVSLTTTGSTGFNVQLVAGNFAIGTAQTYNISNNGSVNSTGGDIASGTTGGTINFNAAGSFTGNMNPYNVFTSGGVNFGTGTVTIQDGGVFRINAGGFVQTNAPFYAAGSTLNYNTGGTYGRGFEWRAASGRAYPHHVLLSNNTTVNPGANGNTGQVLNTGGDVTIQSGSSLFMDFGGNNMTVPLIINGNLTLVGNLSGSGATGGDVRIRGNWLNNGTAANYFPNNRAVFFDGSALQTIGGSNTSANPFAFLFISNAAGLTLAQNVQVNNQVDFTSGTVTLNNFDFRVNNLNTPVNGVNSSRFFITNGTGRLFRRFNNIDTVFPIGPTASTYNPVTLNQIGTVDNIGIRVATAPAYSNAVNDNDQMVLVEYFMSEDVAGGNNFFTGFQWNASNEATSFVRTSGVFHGNWTGSQWVVRPSNPTTGTDPYVSNSTVNFNGTLSNTAFVVGNINGILGCIQSATNGNWNNTGTWVSGIVPPADASVCINHSVSVVGSDADIANVTVNPSGTLVIDPARTLTIANAGGIINNSGASANLGNGTVVFAGVGSVTGANGVVLNNLTLNNNTTLTASTQVNGNLTLNAGSFIVTGSPVYGVAGTLIYNNGGSYNANNEWTGNALTPGAGIPFNVTIQNGTTVNMPAANRGIGGNLLISDGGLTLNAGSGDLFVGGNWTRNNTSTSFTPNNRAVVFNGTSNQTIAITGGGTETYNYLIANKPSGELIISNSPATDVVVNANVGNVLQLINAGAINLNGRTLSLTNNGGNIQVSGGVRNILGGPGSVLAINGNKATTATGGATIVYGQDVTVALSAGLNCGVNLSTIQGTLQIALFGLVDVNPPTYAAGSTLRYFTGNIFNRGAEWSTLSGPGYPHHVVIDLNGTPTTLNLLGASSALRRIAGNLTINNGGNINMGTMGNALEVLGNVTIGGGTSGSLTLGSNFGGDLLVGGNLTRNAGATLTQNTREVVMNGTTNQSILNVAGFDFLAIANTGTAPNNQVTLTDNTLINNRLRLGSGLLNLNTFNVTMANAAEIMRESAAATMSAEPSVSGSNRYDVRYTATLTTGNEFSSSIEAVRDLIIDGAITPVLGADRTFNRDMNLIGGNFDLGVFTLTARGKATAPAFSGSITVTGGGTRVITGSSGSRFDITGLGGNSPTDYTKTVSTSGGTLLRFDANVLVRLGDGSVDFGLGSPTTIDGVLQILLGGSVGQILNPCFYGVNSILRFANTVDYIVHTNDKTWAAGSITSGLPGIPYNVEVLDVGTDLRLESTRALRGNLTITNGSFTLWPTFTGAFNIGGNWTRTGATSGFTHNDKKVIFDGLLAGSQFISVGSGVSAETFYDLEIAAATGSITLGNSTNINVLNNLNFVSGRMDMNNTSNVLTIGTSTVNGTITGFNASRYIISQNGSIVMRTNTNAVYAMPFGDATNYTPFELTLNQGAQAGALITASMNISTHPNINTLNTFEYITRYWDIVPTGLTTSPLPDYDVRYSYAASDEVGTNLTYRAVKYSDTNPTPGWLASPGGPGAIEGTSASHNPATREFVWEGLITFSAFTGAGDGSPLPVTLLDFNAQPVNNEVLVTWTTASEINNDYFQIERSRDAVNYEVVGIVDGAGNSNQVLNYQLLDKQPFTGVSYYRLRQVDFNGDFEVFDPVAVFFGGQSLGAVTVFPNPAKELANIKLESKVNDNGVIQLFNISGAMIWQRNINAVDGINNYQLDIADLPAGQYILTVRMNRMDVRNLPLIITR